MVLDLQYPFNMWYRKGYLRVDSKGRKRVDMRNNKHDSTTTSYARYLMCVKMGDLIPDEYDVDHINGDCSDDRIENLQVLRKDIHYEKTRSETAPRIVKDFICANCNGVFKRELRQTYGRVNLFCSRKCNALYNRKNNGWVGNSK